MNRRVSVIALSLAAVLCTWFLVPAPTISYGAGSAADTTAANAGGTGGCNPEKQFDPSISDTAKDKKGEQGVIGLGCVDPTSGQKGTCTAADVCAALKPPGQPTEGQLSAANNGGTGNSAQAPSDETPAASDDTGSPASSGGTTQVSPSPALSQIETGEPTVVSPEQGAVGVTPQGEPASNGSAPATTQSGPSSLQTALDYFSGANSSFSSESAQSGAGSFDTSSAGGTLPEGGTQSTGSAGPSALQTAVDYFTGADNTGSSAFSSQPEQTGGSVEAPNAAPDFLQSGGENALQLDDFSQEPSGSSVEGASGSGPENAESPTLGPTSLQSTLSNPMGSLNNLNSGVVGGDDQLGSTPGTQVSAQDQQDLNAVQNGASTFGQSAADYVNNGSETNGQFPATTPDGSPYLAQERADLMSPLDPTSPNYDPDLRTEVAAVLQNEADPGEAQQAVLESMVNRSVMDGYGSLSQAINSGFYGPVNTGAVASDVNSGNISAAQYAATDQEIQAVAGGSNICNYCTDQGMINEIQGQKFNIGGEYFGYMGGNQSRSNQQAQLADAYNASYGSQVESALPSEAQTVPYSWAGDISSVASFGSSAPVNESALATAPDDPISWSGQSASTVDWTNVATIYGTPSPTVGEDIASAAEASGEPTTDQAGDLTDAGVWGEQQQSLLDREALADEESAASGATPVSAPTEPETAQGSVETEQANPVVSDLSSPSTGEAAPSQADITQALANAYNNSGDLPEVDAVKSGQELSPAAIVSDDFLANTEQTAPLNPEQTQSQVVANEYIEQTSPSGAPSTDEGGSQAPETAQGTSITEQSTPVVSDLNSAPSAGESALAAQEGLSETGEAIANETPAEYTPNEIVANAFEEAGQGVISPEAIANLTNSEAPFTTAFDEDGAIVNASASLTSTNPLGDDLTGETAPVGAVTSETLPPADQGETAQGQVITEQSNPVTTDLAQQNAPLSAGPGGIGSDVVSSQSGAPTSANDDQTLANAYENALAESATQNEESQTLADREAQADQDNVQYQQNVNDQQSALLEREGLAQQESAAYVSNFEYALSPIPVSENPELSPDAIAQSFTNPNAGITDAEAFSGPTQLPPDLTGETAPVEPVTTEPLPFSGTAEVLNPSVETTETSPATLESSTQLPSWMNDVLTPFQNAGTIAANDYQALVNEFAPSNPGSAPETPQTPSEPTSPQEEGVPLPQERPSTASQEVQPSQEQPVETAPLPTARPSLPSNPSIVDYLDSIGQDTSFAARAALAAYYGIQNYVGSAAQNLQLLRTCFAQGCQP